MYAPISSVRLKFQQSGNIEKQSGLKRLQILDQSVQKVNAFFSAAAEVSDKSSGEFGDSFFDNTEFPENRVHMFLKRISSYIS